MADLPELVGSWPVVRELGQLRELRELCARRGWNVGGTFTDKRFDS